MRRRLPNMASLTGPRCLPQRWRQGPCWLRPRKRFAGRIGAGGLLAMVSSLVGSLAGKNRCCRCRVGVFRGQASAKSDFLTFVSNHVSVVKPAAACLCIVAICLTACTSCALVSSTVADLWSGTSSRSKYIWHTCLLLEAGP